MGTLARTEILITSPGLLLRLLVGSFGAIEEPAAISVSALYHLWESSGFTHCPFSLNLCVGEAAYRYAGILITCYYRSHQYMP